MSQHYQVSREGEIHLMELELPQQMDAAEFDKLNDAIEAAADGAIAGRWVLDLSNAQYIGSAMLGLMVNLRQRIKAGGGRLVLCGLSQHLTRALATCSLHTFFVTVPTRAEAIRKASGR
ncbi:MAG: STAS domain-containing protein [Tepidisphaeraceae bacterium]